MHTEETTRPPLVSTRTVCAAAGGVVLVPVSCRLDVGAGVLGGIIYYSPLCAPQWSSSRPAACASMKYSLGTR